MVCYGALQEKTTWMIYRRQMVAARVAGDELLAVIYRYISRDEAAHGGFYQDVITSLLEEDREGTVADLAHVLAQFTMPAYDLVPDYDDRVRVMRSVGIDRKMFLREVVLPILTRVGVPRRELAKASARPSAPTGDLLTDTRVTRGNGRATLPLRAP
jgi:acyl-[acyl-carrier-protein] desaturase